mmetsp:Transcript_9524/g.21860  ORF Transcript_9524/g.21860 Transcript_9524/m.21860 type:complete len:843 (+) Transcript_9524:55-2583(+)|eukprot:CAMPEP_0114555216 /NCGR_PEP_ID=MMETSP0114-20121206/8632_1 /TAXON_ID=31324 /ORGANISM="Goniomonas sp, Strain m" /LENGTH=842 /DNA_ID=CAMNT_0001740329 /DNA_START=42 /DNA_END=2570 /DNA_ORIENTATION=+
MPATEQPRSSVLTGSKATPSASPVVRKTGGALEKRLIGAKEEDWSRWNIQDLRQNLAEDKALLQATVREANKARAEQGVAPLVDGEADSAPPSRGNDAAEDDKSSSGEEESDEEEADSRPSTAASRTTRQSDTASGPREKTPNKPKRADKPVAKPTGTFLTDLKDGLNDFADLKLSPELENRVRTLEEIIGPERSRFLRDGILKDKKLDREKFSETMNMYHVAAKIGDDARNEDADTNARLQSSLNAARAEIDSLNEKLKALDSLSTESNDKLRRREHEARQLRVEVEAHQVKVRGEEVERLKVIDKVKKKEAEVARLKEMLEKVSAQLTRTLEENEALSLKIAEVNNRLTEKNDQLTLAQEEMRKRESELRVLKRNLHLTLPDEFRKMADKIKELEGDRKKCKTAVEEAEKKVIAVEAIVKQKDSEVLNVKATLEQQNKRIAELDKESQSRHSELKGERKVRGMENRRLMDRNLYYVHKLQGQEDQRVRAMLDNRAVENELAELRKRNMQLLGQILSLDEAKLAAEKAAREAISRSKELQEKLELHNAVQRNELSKLIYSSSHNTEQDVDTVFPVARSHRGGRMVHTSSRSGSVSPAQSSYQKKSASRNSLSDSPLPENESSFHAEPTPPRPKSGGRSGPTPPAVIEGDAMELQVQLSALTTKLAAEERARVAAQERVVELAEQLLQKEKQLVQQNRAKEHHPGKGAKSRVSGDGGGKSNSRVRELQAQNLTLVTRMHEQEVDAEQVQFKLAEREEEVRLQKKKVSELLFKLQVTEEERNRLRDQALAHAPDSDHQAATKQPDSGTPKISTMSASGSGAPFRRGSHPAAEGSPPPPPPQHR